MCDTDVGGSHGGQHFGQHRNPRTSVELLYRPPVYKAVQCYVLYFGMSVSYTPPASAPSREYAQELLAQYVPGAVARDPALYERALTHRTKRAAVRARGSGERLEFPGDAVLYLAVAAYLHTRYPDADEGFLTRLRSRLVRGRMLTALCARVTLLGQHLGLPQDASLDALEDALEAFVGAVHEDQGYEVARTWVVAFLEENVDFAQLVEAQDSAKDVLARHCREAMGTPPAFELLPPPACTAPELRERLSQSSSSKSSQPSVRVRARVRAGLNGRVLATGTGPTRAAAEDAFARNALKDLGVPARLGAAPGVRNA